MGVAFPPGVELQGGHNSKPKGFNSDLALHQTKIKINSENEYSRFQHLGKAGSSAQKKWSQLIQLLSKRRRIHQTAICP